MNNLKYFSVSLLFFLMACGETDKAQVEKPTEEEHILSGHMRALEKAEEAQAKINEGIARQEKAIDEATGSK